MADIVVTTPKTMRKKAALEAKEARDNILQGGESWYFRKVGRIDVREGDRVYYVEDGQVTGFCTVAVINIFKDWQECDTTGRLFAPGRYVLMDARSWNWIEPKPMKGFQGVRYAPEKWTYDVTVLGAWLDDRPELDWLFS